MGSVDGCVGWGGGYDADDVSEGVFAVEAEAEAADGSETQIVSGAVGCCEEGSCGGVEGAAESCGEDEESGDPSLQEFAGESEH